MPPTTNPTWRATGLEAPVFLDRSGHRRRVVGVLGGLGGTMTATWLAALVLGGSGFGGIPAAPLGHHVAAPRPLRPAHTTLVHHRARARHRTRERSEQES